MLATVSLFAGILLGVVVLTIARRGRAAGLPASNVTTSGWLTLAFGVIALAALYLGTRLVSGPGNSGLPWFNISIALSFAALVVGVGMLMRGERGWPTWVGLIAGLIPAGFWVWFALGNLFAG